MSEAQHHSPLKECDMRKNTCVSHRTDDGIGVTELGDQARPSVPYVSITPAAEVQHCSSLDLLKHLGNRLQLCLSFPTVRILRQSSPQFYRAEKQLEL